jgi:putative PIN family toxin of toxin-antitoxin system
MQPSRPPLRAAVDTNLYFSGLILRRGSPHLLIEAWRASRFILLISDDQFDEIDDVLHRPRTRQRYNLPVQVIDEFLDRLRRQADWVRALPSSPIALRDPEDEVILTSALAGNADALVTGDKDLLSVAGDPRLGRLRILTAAEFLEELGLPEPN